MTELRFVVPGDPRKNTMRLAEESARTMKDRPRGESLEIEVEFVFDKPCKPNIFALAYKAIPNLRGWSYERDSQIGRLTVFRTFAITPCTIVTIKEDGK